jgi:hypothetical protein
VFSDTEEQQAIEKICVNLLNTLTTYQQKLSKLIIMNNAIIVTAQLGIHVCTIEMLEQAEQGKERTLKLKLSDKFVDDGHYQGKLKRFWFLVQILHNLGFADNASEMKVSVEEFTGIITIEIPHIDTKKEIFNKFENLIPILNSLIDLDINLNKLSNLQENTNWNFSTLKQKITGVNSIENQQMFNHVAVILGCIVDDINNFSYLKKKKFFPLLLLIKELRPKNIKELRTPPPDPNTIQSLLDNIDGINQENLVFGLLSANVTSIIKFAKEKYPNWFTDKQTMINLVTNNGILLKEASSELQNDIDVVLAAGTENVHALKYASAKLTGNTEFISNFVININSNAIQYAKNEEGYDENIILAIIKNSFATFIYLDDELKQNKTFLLKAIKTNPNVYLLMDVSFLRDKEISDAYKQASKK